MSMMAVGASKVLLVLIGMLALLSAPAAELPMSISNNAVAALAVAGAGDTKAVDYYSFMGLTAGKTWRDVSAKAWWLPAEADGWQALPPVPDAASGRGRLAAVAVAAAGSVWLFGGYSVAADGSETSSAEVYRVNARQQPVYQRSTPMPIAVDDTLALVYQDRYIYLVSGWHDLGNVNLVQVFDSVSQSWSQATPYPGTPVFGHGGAMLGEQLVVCGGVALDYPSTGQRRFRLSEQCWRGSIDSDDHRRIDWHRLPSMPGPARYRAAATADAGRGLVIFAAGSARAYNYNGIGYDGIPAAPLDSVVSYDLAAGQWRCHRALDVASMDHRALLLAAQSGELIRIGGMRAGQQVSAAWLQQALPAIQPCPPAAS